MRLVSWNVQGLTPWTDFGPIARYLAKLDPDVVCLQEVWWENLARRLWDKRHRVTRERLWPHRWWQEVPQRWFPLWSRPTGLLLLSKLAWTAPRSVRYEASGWEKWDPLAGHKGAQVVFFPELGLELVHTHGDAGRADGAVRLSQYEQLSGVLSEEGPLLLVGDLNLDPDRVDDVETLLWLQGRFGLKRLAEDDVDYVLGRDVEGLGVVLSGAPDGPDHRPLLFETQTRTREAA